MEYRFSDRVSSLKPSAIREIFKYAADPSPFIFSIMNGISLSRVRIAFVSWYR